MTAKKRWFPNSTNNPLTRRKSDPDISWSNSDTEDEDELNYLRKKPKLSEKSIKTKTKSSNWIQITPPPNNNNNNNVTNDKTNLIRNVEQRRESPIINKTKSLTPILTQTYFRQTSPIISGREILQRIKSRHQSNGDDDDDNEGIVKDIDDNSSISLVEIFQTQSSDQCDHPLEISPIKTQLSQPINDLNIDIVLTQDSCPVIIDSSSNTIESQSNQPSPQSSVRKKQFKKDGLGYQLMKAINLQKTNYNIWQHEIYLNKIEMFDNDQRIDFKIIKQWLEYCLNVYECECTIITDRFLLIIGTNTKLNFPFEINRKYSLFPPYNWKFINYQNCQLKCYFNCVKFMQN